MKTSPIFVALSTFAQYGREPITLLEQSGYPFTVNPMGRRLTADEVVQNARGSLGIVAGVEPYPSEVLTQLVGLRCISRCGVGVDNIDLQKARELNIKVCITPDPVVTPVAELAIGMLIDLLRQITTHTNLLRAKEWKKKDGKNLAGQTVGIIGLGRIGKRVAELLSHFGCRVIASDPRVDEAWCQQRGVTIVDVDTLLRTADIVSLHLSVDQRSPFMMAQREINLMKPGAVLLNLSRGDVVDEDALYHALRSGHLSGAGMDVYPQEPYTGKLCELDNVVLTPHVATLTRESRVAMEVQAVKNLIEGVSSG